MNERKEKMLIAMTCLFAGMVIGFLIAPIKGRIQCGNNSGNHYKGSEFDKEEKVKQS